MHPNPVFRTADAQQNLQFAAKRGFGTLALSQDGAPLLAHVPFTLNIEQQYAELHLLRSNPIARAVTTPVAVVLAVNGPDSYISPDWYQLADQVPTWNYVAVHLTGVLEPMPQADIKNVLARLSTEFETRLAPKPEWLMEKTEAGALDKMMQMIRPFVLRIAGVDGTWKLAQNKPEAARKTAAKQVASHGIGLGQESLAALMQTGIMAPE